MGASRLGVTCLGLLAASLSVAAPPPLPGEEPAAGRFLVARRLVEGPFAESVVLLVEHGAHGSVGLVVNQPTRLPLSDLLPDVDGLAARGDRVHVGGPVAQETVRLLVRTRDAPPSSLRVLDDVWLSASPETLGGLLEKPSPPFRAYVGYAGWAAGQLEDELRRGVWVVAPAHGDAVFGDDLHGLWSDLLRRHEGVRTEAPRPEGHRSRG